MTAPSELWVWMDGLHVATVCESRSKMTMIHTDEARPLGVPLLSMSMPVSSRRFPDGRARPFLAGLLPEGEARSMIAYDLAIDAIDDLGLLAALGRDCAGALVIQPPAEPPPPPASTHVGDAIEETVVARKLRELPMNPLGIDQLIRVSLAGVQPKLLLTRTVDGRWALPADGAVSTHILKPAHARLPDAVANEAFCMKVAAHAGLRAAETELDRIDGIDVLVSTRFDRAVDEGGHVRRVHQEDACQALSILTRHPARKYQATGGPSLAAIAGLLSNWGGVRPLDDLVAQVVLNVVLGNADFHGKNLSFLLDPHADVRLTPVYAVMGTAYYRGQHGSPRVDTSLAMHVSRRTDIDDVTMHDVIAEACSWGLRPSHATALVHELLERLPAAIGAATEDVPTVPADLVDLVGKRVAAARSGRRPGAH